MQRSWEVKTFPLRFHGFLLMVTAKKERKWIGTQHLSATEKQLIGLHKDTQSNQIHGRFDNMSLILKKKKQFNFTWILWCIPHWRFYNWNLKKIWNSHSICRRTDWRKHIRIAAKKMEMEVNVRITMRIRVRGSPLQPHRNFVLNSQFTS